MEVLKITQVYNKLSVKNDYVFKRLFTKKGNEKYLKEFLSSLLKMDIREIRIEHDKRLDQNLKSEKYGVLDVKATLNGNVEVNIEIQINDYKNIVKRVEYYASKMLAFQLKPKEDYKKLKPVIIVAILDFEHFKFKEYITKGVIVSDKHRDEIIDNILTFYYIELPKFRKSKIDTEDKVAQWLSFIDGEDEKRIGEVMRKNDNIKKADEELEYLSSDEATRRLAEMRESGLREMASAKACGIEEGIEKGAKYAKIDMIKAMLKKKMSIDDIIEITGLTKKEIEEIIK